VASAAVETAASSEIAAAVEAAASMEVPATIATIESASVIPTSTVVTATVVAVSTTVETPTIIATVSVVAVIPGAGTDEDAADEPVRSIISVGGAGIRIIAVVAIGADWSRTVISRDTDSDAKGDALGVRVRRGEETNSETNAEQAEKLQISHF
jgi:hypothetical protein